MLVSKLTRRSFAVAADAKVAPSAWFYMLNYGIKASQVHGSGPKGHITKEDLITFINKNKLQRVSHEPTQPVKVVT